MLNSDEAATKLFTTVVEGIKAIRDTDGYNQIKGYWYREYDDAIAKIATVDVEKVGEVACLRQQISNARQFLNWLDSLEGQK